MIVPNTAAEAAAARTAARVAVEIVSEQRERARNAYRRAEAVQTAVRARYGMKPGDVNGFNANEHGTRYGDVKAVDTAERVAFTELMRADDAYEAAVAERRAAERIASAFGMERDVNALTAFVYRIARRIAAAE